MTGEAQINAVPLTFIRNLRARRYVLRLRADGSARVTIPRGGSVIEAHRFAKRNHEWLARQLLQQIAKPNRPEQWLVGTEIFFRGELLKIKTGIDGSNNVIRFSSEAVKIANGTTDFRPLIERHLWRLAAKELPLKLLNFAAMHHLIVRRITVRNQKSRWGSCSRRGTISLNWRLIQTPAFVQEYILLHELMHLRQMNHSPRFWQEVKSVCPDYEVAERWLKQHSSLLC